MLFDDLYSNDIINACNITTKTLFIVGSSSSYINWNNTLNINGGSNGVNFYGGKMAATVNAAGTSMLFNSQVLKSNI